MAREMGRTAAIADRDGRAHRGAAVAGVFNEKFFEEASDPLVTERIYKRFHERG